MDRGDIEVTDCIVAINQACIHKRKLIPPSSVQTSSEQSRPNRFALSHLPFSFTLGAHVGLINPYSTWQNIDISANGCFPLP